MNIKPLTTIFLIAAVVAVASGCLSEKQKQLKSTYYFKRGSEHVSIPDSVGR